MIDQVESIWRSRGFYCYLIKRQDFIPFHVFKYFSYLLRISNDCNHFHLMATFFVDQRTDFLHPLGKPCQTPPYCLWCTISITENRVHFESSIYHTHVLSQWLKIYLLSKINVFNLSYIILNGYLYEIWKYIALHELRI